MRRQSSSSVLPSLLLAALVLASSPAFAQVPGLEGYGADSIGGRGGELLPVTNLSDSGYGSLRWAIEASGPRVIVFRVAGEIHLSEALRVREPFVTIAGQTAPGSGITLRDHGLIITTHDVIVQGLRIRPGEAAGPDIDGISITGRSSTTVERVVVDHCSVEWASDEAIGINAIAGVVRDVTIQNTILSSSLLDHNLGLLLNGRDYADQNPERISVHRNIIANMRGRFPYLGPLTEGEITNNVLFNWETSATSLDVRTRANVVSNCYFPGAQTSNDTRTIDVRAEPGDDFPAVFVEGNLCPGETTPTARSLGCVTPSRIHDLILDTPVLPRASTSVETAALACASVQRQSGALPRDAVDTLVVEGIATRAGAYIASEDEMGGYPPVEPGTSPLDDDNDGMADAYEMALGLDPSDRDDRNQMRDGATELEWYLASLLSEGEMGSDCGARVGGACTIDGSPGLWRCEGSDAVCEVSDAGTPTDAGAISDAGVVSDAGTTDAGAPCCLRDDSGALDDPAGSAPLEGGCSASRGGTSVVWFLLPVLLLGLRRRSPFGLLMALLVAGGCGSPADPAGTADASTMDGSTDTSRDGGGEDAGDAASCRSLHQEATLVSRPVDVVVTIDNSSSMGAEIEEVEAQFATNFYRILEAADPPVDYRVILVSSYQDGQTRGRPVCISEPLGSAIDADADGHCDEPYEVEPIENERFVHYARRIDSNDSLCVLLDSWGSPDDLGRHEAGWQSALRPGAFTFLAVVSDDDVRCETDADLRLEAGDDMGTEAAAAFDAALRALDSERFGSEDARNYSYWSIVGQAPYMPAGDRPGGLPVPADIAATEDQCEPSTEAAGVVHQSLSILTDGYRYPSCGLEYTPLFELMAQGVVEGAQIPCVFDLPDAPEGTVLDLSTAHVTYRSGSEAEAIEDRVDESACSDGGYYIDGSQLRLCPAMCSRVRSDPAAQIDLDFDCVVGLI